MATLNEIGTGTAIIRAVSGDARFVARVTAVGLTSGCRVEVLQNVRRRPVIIYARDSVVALDRDDCSRIEVEVVA